MGEYAWVNTVYCPEIPCSIPPIVAETQDQVLVASLVRGTREDRDRAQAYWLMSNKVLACGCNFKKNYPQIMKCFILAKNYEKLSVIRVN